MTDTMYDPYLDPDMETCSWCVQIVKDSSLREIADGARLCKGCFLEAQMAANEKIARAAR